VNREIVSDELIRRLQATSALDEEDVRAIRSLPLVVKRFRANEVIVHDGDRPSECCLVMEGFCLRSKTTSDGRRQILSIHMPGDIPDLQTLHLHLMDHDLAAVTDCTLGFINHAALREVTRRRPGVAEVFWRDTLIDAARFREWIVNVGQRPALTRLAHILLEVRERLKIINKVRGNRFEMPLTQEQLGDAMGITPVHVNRVVKQLRDEGVVEFQRGAVTVINEGRLEQIADFDDLYLHQAPST
jgi:CRP-like cAMP-binding protein